jgi:hypothetical protein
MTTEQETTKAEKIEKGSTIGKAALISILSPILAVATAGVGGAISGLFGSSRLRVQAQRGFGSCSKAWIYS